MISNVTKPKSCPSNIRSFAVSINFYVCIDLVNPSGDHLPPGTITRPVREKIRHSLCIRANLLQKKVRIRIRNKTELYDDVFKIGDRSERRVLSCKRKQARRDDIKNRETVNKASFQNAFIRPPQIALYLHFPSRSQLTHHQLSPIIIESFSIVDSVFIEMVAAGGFPSLIASSKGPLSVLLCRAFRSCCGGP